jgi:hypothetical protein
MDRNPLETLLNIVFTAVYVVYKFVAYMVSLILNVIKDILQNIYERIIKYAGRLGCALFVGIVIYASTLSF